MLEKPSALPFPRLLDHVRSRLRTEEAHLRWISRFVLFHGGRQLRSLGVPDFHAFLSELAGDRHVTPSTRGLARAALQVLSGRGEPVAVASPVSVPAPRTRRRQTVLSQYEVDRLLRHAQGTPGLVVRLLYGTGMRLPEALRLRVRDLDLEMHRVTVRNGRGERDRVTVLPEVLVPPLHAQLAARKVQHGFDAHNGCGEAWIPPALVRLYPGSASQWDWQYVFAAPELSVDPRTGVARRRNALEAEPVLCALKQAAWRAGLRKPASPAILRRSFAAHLLECGYSLAEVQGLLGERDYGAAMGRTPPRRAAAEVARSPGRP